MRKFYLFDVLNPDAIENGTEKPHVVPRGPYTYRFLSMLMFSSSICVLDFHYYFLREIWEKKNVEFIGDNFLRFIPLSTLVFAPEYSNGTEEDLVTL